MLYILLFLLGPWGRISCYRLISNMTTFIIIFTFIKHLRNRVDRICHRIRIKSALHSSRVKHLINLYAHVCLQHICLSLSLLCRSALRTPQLAVPCLEHLWELLIDLIIIIIFFIIIIPAMTPLHTITFLLQNLLIYFDSILFIILFL